MQTQDGEVALLILAAIFVPRVALLFTPILPHGEFGYVLGFFLTPRVVIALVVGPLVGGGAQVALWCIALVLDSMGIFIKWQMTLASIAASQEMMARFRHSSF